MGLFQRLGAVCILALCCSCSGESAATPLPTQPQSTSTAEGVQSQLLSKPVSFSGDSFYTSEPFELDDVGQVEVSWDYSGKGPFAFWILNNSEFNSDPKYDRILVKNVDDKNTSGKATVDLIAGNYVIEVEIADGPWQITVAAAKP